MKQILLQGFEIVTTSGTQVFSASCPSGKKVLGCHIEPTFQGAEAWRRYYPSDDGSSCTCYDYFGAAYEYFSYKVVRISGSQHLAVGDSQNKIMHILAPKLVLK